jgi:hypothetical protein
LNVECGGERHRERHNRPRECDVRCGSDGRRKRRFFRVR